MAQSVGSGNAPDRADAVGCVYYLFVRIQNEISRVEYLSILLPEGPDLLRIPRHLKSIGDGKSQLLLLYGLSGLFQRIYGKRNDINILFLKGF